MKIKVSWKNKNICLHAFRKINKANVPEIKYIREYQHYEINNGMHINHEIWKVALHFKLTSLAMTNVQHLNYKNKFCQ